MPQREAPTAPGPVPADVVELERALSRIAHLLTRAKQHDRTTTEAGVEIDRAGVPVLRLLGETDRPMRLGELAAGLGVEAPHVTRQVQRLERAGFVERVPDLEDRRAQRIRPTPAGREALEAMRAVGRQWMHAALVHWTPADRELLASLFHRMVDDFLAHGQRADAFGAPAPAPGAAPEPAPGAVPAGTGPAPG